MDSTQKMNCTVSTVYSVDDIASILAISKSSAYSLVKKKLFKTVRIGTAIRISKSSFDKWLNEQE